jgi:hypothetical protein
VNWTRSINGYYAIHVQQGFPQCFALNLPANAHSDIDATKASDLMRQQQQCSCPGHATPQLLYNRDPVGAMPHGVRTAVAEARHSS